jgi:hypothetical protein
MNYLLYMSRDFMFQKFRIYWVWRFASHIILEAGWNCGTDSASSPSNRGLFSTYRVVSILFQRVTRLFREYNGHVLKFIQTTPTHLFSDSTRLLGVNWQCDAEINLVCVLLRRKHVGPLSDKLSLTFSQTMSFTEQQISALPLCSVWNNFKQVLKLFIFDFTYLTGLHSHLLFVAVTKLIHSLHKEAYNLTYINPARDISLKYSELLHFKSLFIYLLAAIRPASRPALGPTQSPIQWVPGVLSPAVKLGRGVTLTTHPHLVPRLRMSRSYTSSPPMCLRGVWRDIFTFFLSCYRYNKTWKQ